MEKLIELLNQFEKEKKSGFTWRSIDSYDNCVYGVDCDGETEITMYSDLYSKRYEFIKWLVDNDKIDIEPIMKKEIGYWRNVEGVRGYETYNLENALLMLLAIQDSPLEFLVSILK